MTAPVEYDLGGGVTVRTELPLVRDGLRVTLSVVSNGTSVVGPDRLNLDDSRDRDRFIAKAKLNVEQVAKLITMRERILLSIENSDTSAAMAAPSAATTFTAADLLARDYDPIRVVVPGIIVEGAWFLAGKGKLGKSWWCYGLAVALASGGYALGRIAVARTGVLYLSLEDGERRAQRRLRDILGDRPAPGGFHLATTWRKLDTGGLADLETWLDAHPEVTVIIIDTLKKVRAHGNARDRLYDSDYDAVAPLTDLAHRRGLCLIVVTHCRKADASDVLDEISGSTGLTVAVDGALIFKRARGEQQATLHAIHRDLDDREIVIAWDDRICNWVLVGDADEYALSDERQEIIRAVRRLGRPASPIEIATAMGKVDANGRPDTAALRRLLMKMKDAGQVDSPMHGKYALVGHNGHDSNDSHESNGGNGGHNPPSLMPIVTGLAPIVTDCDRGGHNPNLENAPETGLLFPIVTGVTSDSNLTKSDASDSPSCEVCDAPTAPYTTADGRRVCAVCITRPLPPE